MTEPQPQLHVSKASAIVQVSSGLEEDCDGFAELFGQVLRGEIELRPLPPPPRHRCLACALVSLLPGHSRCPHGYLDRGCPCEEA